MLKKNKGFSLIELLVAMLILLLLSSFVMARVVTHRKIVRDRLREEDLKSIQQATEAFFVEKGRFPGDLAELTNAFPVNTKDPKKGPVRYYNYSYDSLNKFYCIGARMEVKSGLTPCTVGSGNNYTLKGP